MIDIRQKATRKRQPIEWVVDKKTGCWNCLNRTGTGGYPQSTFFGRSTRVHRGIYEVLFGFLTPDVLVRHKCDNRRCINPEHLETGSHADNMRDCKERGRTLVGEKNNQSKLTNEDVLNIRENKDRLTRKQIAEKYGVTTATITNIWRHRFWKTVHPVNITPPKTSKLTPGQVREIRNAPPTIKALAKKYGVSVVNAAGRKPRSRMITIVTRLDGSSVKR